MARTFDLSGNTKTVSRMFQETTKNDQGKVLTLKY